MRSILILQTARLGDLVQTAPLLRRLRVEHPEARITLISQQGFAGIIEDCGYYDEMVKVPLADLDGLSDQARQDAFPNVPPFDAHPAFRGPHDLLINLSNDLGSSILCERIPALAKLGRINTYAGELRLLGPWAKYLFAMVSHRLENLFNLVDIQVGMAGLKPQPEAPALPVSESMRAEALALLANAGKRPGHKLVALQAGASELHRAWSLENFAAVARSLRSSMDADILLMGDSRERERTEQLAEMIGPGVINLAGQTSLAQMPAILSGCDLLISNDTGTIHVAAAAGTTTLGLYFSSAYYSETAPYGEGHGVLQVEIPCAPCNTSARCPVQLCREFLPPDAVLETARWLLDGSPAGSPPPRRANLSFYKSRFSGNGSLIYLPVRPEAASSHFLSGLLGRLLWEETLGLGRDAVLDESLRLARGALGFEDKRAALAAALQDLETPIRHGLDLAEKLKAEFESEAPVRERIIFLHGNLAKLGSTLAAASKPAGLCGSFLHYEMMDMDYATYPMLAEILEGKYRMMAEWTARFRETLQGLAPQA